MAQRDELDVAVQRKYVSMLGIKPQAFSPSDLFYQLSNHDSHYQIILNNQKTSNIYFERVIILILGVWWQNTWNNEFHHSTGCSTVYIWMCFKYPVQCHKVVLRGWERRPHGRSLLLHPHQAPHPCPRCGLTGQVHTYFQPSMWQLIVKQRNLKIHQSSHHSFPLHMIWS